METQLLATFIAVAETESFSAAAAQLHLSQPAISKRVALLEQQVGNQLFDRVARQVRLTDVGRTLLPFARKVLQDVEDARRALSHLTTRVGGRLSIGTSHHIGLHRLPGVLRAYTQAYPGVDLDIQFMDSEVACEAVLAGKLELGIVTLPTQPLPQLQTRLVWPDPLAVVVAPTHPLVMLKKPKLANLAEYAAVLPDVATYTHRIVTAALEQHGLRPRIRLSTNYLETLKMLVVIGLGWSVLPCSMLDHELVALAIPELALQRQLGVVWHQKHTLSAAANALLGLLPTVSE